MIRAFVAIDLPESERRALATLQRALRASHLRASWVHERNYHLTLRFLGDCKDETLEALRASLREIAAAHPPLPLRLEGLGAFPNPRKASVLWAGLTGDIDNLKALQQAIESAARSAGLPAEPKGFHAHITLARFRRRPPRELLPVLLEEHSGFQGDPFTAEQAVLYRSELHPKGARYHPIEVFPLKGAPSH